MIISTLLIFLSIACYSAFSPIPSIKTSGNQGATTSKFFDKQSQVTKLYSSSASANGGSRDNVGYDYCYLEDSEIEQERLTSQYICFDHDKWLRHRASDRFYRTIFQPESTIILKSLLDEAAVLAAICVSIIGWNELVVDGYTDFSAIHHDPIFSDVLPNWKLHLPTEPFFICGGPLGLLLVFRNDASFGRYKDAFHHWETITASLSNMLLMASHSSSNVEGVRNMGTTSWALCRTLQHELLGGFDPVDRYECDIRMNIDENQADRLLSSRNKLYRAQYDLHEAVDVFNDEVSNLDSRTLINSVNAVSTACAECERLYKTPIPLLYTKQTLRFLTLWMSFMPFAFYDLFASSWNHILMIPAITAICILFFGIEEIAVSLEEPFSILPLDEMVQEFSMNVEDSVTWMAEKKKL